MEVGYHDYGRINHILKDDLMNELSHLLSIDSDKGLYAYAAKNEKAIGKKLGGGFCIGTNSGTTALQLSLAALGIGKGDEVITMPNTYIATLLAISNTGAKPILVDIAEETMLMDINDIEDKISEKTKAILPVHLYGQMCNMEKIGKISKKHGLKVVEDACHAHLARYSGNPPGAFSDAACYSFFPNKNLGGLGGGGMAITRNWIMSRKIRILRDEASNNPLVLKSLRTPALLDWSQIAFIKARMKYSPEWTERRREIAETYHEKLEGLPLELPCTDKKAYHVYRDFVIRVKNRDKLRKYLKRNGIETEVHYPLPVHLTKTYSYLGYKKGSLPISERTCETAVSLPISPLLSDDEAMHVIQMTRKFFR